MKRSIYMAVCAIGLALMAAGALLILLFAGTLLYGLTQVGEENGVLAFGIGLISLGLAGFITFAVFCGGGGALVRFSSKKLGWQKIYSLSNAFIRGAFENQSGTERPA